HRHQRAGGSRGLQAGAAQPRAAAKARAPGRRAHLLPSASRSAGAGLCAPGRRGRRAQVAAATAGGRGEARMSKLAGKVAIVTGTSPNIGGGIAQGLADEGAAVACVDVTEDNARECAEWIVKRGGRALGLACDVTDEAQVEAMVARVRSSYGGVDILVNN